MFNGRELVPLKKLKNGQEVDIGFLYKEFAKDPVSVGLVDHEVGSLSEMEIVETGPLPSSSGPAVGTWDVTAQIYFEFSWV